MRLRVASAGLCGFGQWRLDLCCPLPKEEGPQGQALGRGGTQGQRNPLSQSCERQNHVVSRRVPAAAAEGKRRAQLPNRATAVPRGHGPVSRHCGEGLRHQGRSPPGWWQVWCGGNTSDAHVRLCWPQLAVASVLLHPGLQCCPKDSRVCVFYPSPPLPQIYYWFLPTLWPFLRVWRVAHGSASMAVLLGTSSGPDSACGSCRVTPDPVTRETP